MNYLSLENITKTYGEKVLFQNLSLQINKGQKVALVAKNGTGKSTLLRVIAGIESAEGEQAHVLLRRDVRVGYLVQEPDFHESDTILDAVLDSDNPLIQTIKRYEHTLLGLGTESEMQTILAKMDDLKAWDMEARIKEMLFKFKISQLDQRIGQLSGGQKKRLALAKILLNEPELLILDEPTNHLDLDMIEWLETYMQQPNLTLFMVTHDRYFLERVCNQIVELENGKLYRYSGNYSDYLEKKAIRQETESAELDKNRKLLGRELDWVRRSPQARTTKAKSRVDAYYELEDKVANVTVDKDIQIDIKGQRLGKKILELHNVSKSYEQFKIVENFSYKFKKNERVGIVGPNGVGKTTFLKVLTKELRPDTGKVVIGDNTVFGYYTQDGIQLTQDKRVIDAVQDIAEYIPLEKGQKLSAAALLERFLFTRKQQQVYVSQLSGGERRRLYLLLVLMQNPNFLILDEPTNDLDILTLNVLEDFLLEFPGCIIVVSHDRFFMDKIVDHLFVFEGNGQIKDFLGDYSGYREVLKERERELRRNERAEQQKNKAPEQTPSDRPRLSQEARKEMNKLEKEIKRLEERKSEIMEQFNTDGLSPVQIEQLGRELSELSAILETKEMRWLELAELA
ncbi:MAG TPA: ABC-F family ATP-binding cassette domain-containing protein [Saprospiraceae bacterium]|nr:ABC-F family ATP-binding cassette domain-containing protein [Saprospiraceae bacterium]HMP13071.1 ABC-F family ATP-binding cassette domain-containing protein [Saprospiraceae bacterium]